MTYQVWDDGPFCNPSGSGPDYYEKRWALRCNGDKLLGDDWYDWMICANVSDNWEKTTVAEMRESAKKEGWRTYKVGNKVMDVCPGCRHRFPLAKIVDPTP